MTKNKDDAQKGTLKWRLSQAPNYNQVTELLDLEVITPQEAKQILFSSANTKEQVKALEEQVEFLKDIIDRLSKQPPQQVWTYVNTYKPINPWYNTGVVYSSPSVLCSSVGALASNSSTSGSTVTYSMNTVTGTGSNTAHLAKGTIHTK